MSKKDIGYIDLMRNLYSVDPKRVEGISDTSFFYYRHKLFSMIKSIIKVDGLLDNWNEDYFMNTLINDGAIYITNSKYGIVAVNGNSHGYNYMHMPTDFIITNEVLGTIEGKLGIDGDVIYYDWYYRTYYNLNDMITRYSVMLANIDGSINTNLMNTRVAFVFYGSNQKEIKEKQLIYDKISKGQPAVFTLSNDVQQPTSDYLNVRNNYIVGDLMDAKRRIMAEFLTEIGINNTNTSKKERLITDESESNSGEINANIDRWINCLNRSAENVNSLYGLNISFTYNRKVNTTMEDLTEESNDKEEVKDNAIEPI